MKAVSRSRFLTGILPFVLVFPLLLFLVPVSGITVSNNSAKILLEARQWSQGKVPALAFEGAEATRGPLLPLMLAMGFELGGGKVQIAAWLIRSFLVLNILLAYFLGKALFGPAAGFLCSGFVLTSPGINGATAGLNADIVHPFFILSFILLYHVALEKTSRRRALFSGFVLGLALMVKESALFCLAIPVGMAVFAPPALRKERVRIGLWVFSAALVTLVPWAVYAAKNYGSWLPILGVAHPQYQLATAKQLGFSGPLGYWGSLFLWRWPQALGHYYQAVLREATPLSLWLVVSFAFVVARGLLLKKRGELLLAVSVLGFLPLILRAGDLGLRPGQTVMIQMILYFSLAAMIVSGVQFLADRFRKTRDSTRPSPAPQDSESAPPFPTRGSGLAYALIALIGLSLMTNQMVGKDRTWAFWISGENALGVFSKEPFKVRGRYTLPQQQAAEWTRKNASPGTRIAADGFTQEALEFFGASNGDISVFHPVQEISVPAPLSDMKKREGGTRPLFLITYHSFSSGPDRLRVLFLVFESDILDFLRRERSDYLVISGKGLFMRSYFDRAEWAPLRYENGDLRIYEIRRERMRPLGQGPVGVNETIREHLDWLEKSHPDEYSLFEKKIATWGLDVKALLSSPLQLRSGEVY